MKKRRWDWFRSPEFVQDVREFERELREERMTDDEAAWLEPWMDGSDVGMYGPDDFPVESPAVSALAAELADA